MRPATVAAAMFLIYFGANVRSLYEGVRLDRSLPVRYNFGSDGSAIFISTMEKPCQAGLLG